MWEQVDSNKATDKQIKYAETLLEAYYGDINLPIYTMTKQEISVLIDDVKKKCSEKKIHLSGNTEEVQLGETVEGRLMPYTAQVIFDEYATSEAMRSSIPAHEHCTGSAIRALRNATSEAIRRRDENLLRRGGVIRIPSYEHIGDYAARLAESIKRTEIQRLATKIEREGRFDIIHDPMDFTSTIRLRCNSFCRNAVLTRQIINDVPNALERTKKELIEVMAKDIYRDRLRQERERSVYGTLMLFYGAGEVETLRGDE